MTEKMNEELAGLSYGTRPRTRKTYRSKFLSISNVTSYSISPETTAVMQPPQLRVSQNSYLESSLQTIDQHLELHPPPLCLSDRTPYVREHRLTPRIDDRNTFDDDDSEGYSSNCSGDIQLSVSESTNELCGVYGSGESTSELLGESEDDNSSHSSGFYSFPNSHDDDDKDTGVDTQLQVSTGTAVKHSDVGDDSSDSSEDPADWIQSLERDSNIELFSDPPPDLLEHIYR